MGPVYYCPVHPYNTISSGALNFYVVFQNIISEPLDHCDYVVPQVVLGDHPTILKTILTIFKSKFVKVNPHRVRHIIVPTVCAISKQNLYQIIHQRIGHIYIYKKQTNGKKRTHGRSSSKST